MEEWSKEPPKEDGFYWVCEPEYTQPEVVRLARPWVYYGGSMEPMPRAVQDIPAWGPKVEIPPMVAKGIFPVFPPFEESETKEVNTCSECGERGASQLAMLTSTACSTTSGIACWKCSQTWRCRHDGLA